MPVAWRILPAILFAAVLSAQPPTELLRAAQSPYDLAKYAKSHDEIDGDSLWASWKASNPNVVPCSYRGTDPCMAEILTVQKSDQAIVSLHGDLPQPR